MSQTFPKAERLSKRRQYELLARYGERIFGKRIAIELRRKKTSGIKLGITVTKKFGKAHDRNRFKRVIREAFRQCKEKLPQSIDINIRPTYSCRNSVYTLKPLEVEQEMIGLLRK